MVMGLAGAPFGVVNAIQYSTDGHNLSFITVGWFEIHSCVALLAAWLGVNTSSAFSLLSSPSLFVVFFFAFAILASLWTYCTKEECDVSNFWAK